MPDDRTDTKRLRSIQSQLSKLFVHDLKNPISALSANLSFLESSMTGDSSDARSAVADSILAAEMLLGFSDNLNYIAMLENAEKCPVSELGLDAFLRIVSRRSRKFAQSAGVEIEIDEAPKDIYVVWQHRYAELVLENLIASAVRHSPQGGKVRVSATVDGNEVRFSITDWGKPVEKEFADRLFTAEVQAEAKNNSGCRYGRGLGLYAAGLAAQALGGRLEVSTKEGLTVFIFTAPLSVAE